MFSNDQLRDLIKGKIIGDKFPYDTGDEKEIEDHIRRLFYRIKRNHKLVCEAEWGHFGSGYASFVEFFCYSKEQVTVLQKKNGVRKEEIHGIIIDICRLAPVAIMGEDIRYKTFLIETNEIIGRGYGTLLDGQNSLTVSVEFQTAAAHLKKSLNEYNYELLHAEGLKRFLPFQEKIPTIYRAKGQYLVMDAIFYWED